MKSKHILASLAVGLTFTMAMILVWNSTVEGAAVNTVADSTPGVTPTPTPAPAESRLYHHTFPKAFDGHTSTLYLQNSGSDAATVALSFEDLSGGAEYSLNDTIPAQGMLKVPADSLSALPDGARYSLIVSSDQPVQSVVRIERPDASGDTLASYRGVSTGSTALHLGPFHKAWPETPVAPWTSFNSSIVAWNISGSTAAVGIDFLNPDGSTAATASNDVAPGEQWMVDASAQSALPDGFRGWARVTADQPIVGWLHQIDTANEVFQIYGRVERSMVPGSSVSALPRALRRVDEGSGPRTTNLFVGNTGSGQATGMLSYSDADGTQVQSSSFVLSAAGATVFDLGQEPGLPDGGMWAALVSGNEPLLMGEVYYDESARVPVGTYGSEAADQLELPRVARTAGGHTVFTVQNLGSADASVSVGFYDSTGNPILNQATTVPAGGWVRYDQSDMSQLGDTFEGSAVIQSAVPLMAHVDEYVYPACEPVSNVEIARTPTGDLFTGNTVRFTASATGTMPLSYTWTVDGASVSAEQSTFEHSFSAAGAHTVGVTVTNDCGQGSDTLVIDVQEPTEEQSDLSKSYKSASLTNVEEGDLLTYTLFLRNTSPVTASATLTDPVPAHTTYVSGSAQASDGNAVTLVSGELLWSGEIISGTPVAIDFAVDVGKAPVGTVITNAARLNDGLGNVIQLGADAVYNPGYRLTIYDGALATAVPTVTLSLSWAAEDPPIEKMQISNDGGFGSGTGWIDVSDSYSAWVLDTYGDLRLPRTVYALFRDEEGKQYGPLQDDIIYDPDPPQLAGVEIITQTTTQSVRSVEGEEVIVRVTASDDNSGLARVQISHSEDFGGSSEFGVTGGTTDIPWTLQPSGEVYVRVVDRAGNVSESESQQGPSRYEVFLPALLR